MNTLLDYEFSSAQVSSKGGGHDLNFGSASTVAGPSNSELGRFATALRLGGTRSASANIGGLAFTPHKFTIRTVLKPLGKVTGRQNIVESDDWPFALMLNKGKNDATVTVSGSVNSVSYGWRGVDTRFVSSQVRTDRWASVDLVYDIDTLALFINGTLSDIQAFPRGALKAMRGSKLFVGSWTDGRRNRFKGDLAALQIIAGAPTDLDAKLDEKRTSPAWHISRKRIDVESTVNLGSEAGPVRFNSSTGAYTQDFARGLIMYHDSIGAAFEMHGSIWTRYKSFGRKDLLGYLVSDEGNSLKRGAKKSLFSKGGIYWSSRTGAKIVRDRIYLDYEDMGEARAIGLPTGEQRNISGGEEQIFEGARMYRKRGEDKAHEVHGSILARFLQTGGVGKWGYPRSNEVDVTAKGNGGRPRAIGKMSEFEGATFYWSRQTGAFEVHGDIRKKYLDCNGPAGELGFPTSNEVDIPRHSGVGRMNTFQKGAICWYGSWNSIIVARPFKVFVGRVSTRESEGFGMGQNDLYTFIRASDGTQTYNKRHPRRGDWGGKNSKDINLTIPNRFTPNRTNYKVAFRFKVVDSDPGDDDHLGTFNFELNASNGWGLRNRQGIFNSSFSKVRSLTWSVKPQVNISELTEPQKWWGEDNARTNKINYQKYSRAFSDVDSDPEWWDLTDWLEKAFYELVVEGLASGGNCYGMSLEAIYARKNRSVFGMPLDRFKTWSTLESEFNIKHCYQVGAQAIWWFLGQFVTGNTHDPKDVFRRTRDAFNRGDNPLVCISQNYDFSGGPHCIMPVGWHQGSSQWTMDILDPNFPGELKRLTVDPRRNTFRYVGSRTYRGGEWSGGRFHYMPYHIVDSMPRTPIWDAILLLLAGTLIIFADDAESVSIKDGQGRDLNAFGNAAKTRLQNGDSIEDCFFDYSGFAGEAVKGGMLFRRNPLRSSGDIRSNGSLTATTPVRNVASANFRNARALNAAMREATAATRAAIGDRTAHHVLADANLRATLNPALTSALGNLAAANREGTWTHRLRGTRNGKLGYAVCSAMSSAKLDSPMVRNEIADIGVQDMDSSKQSLSLKAAKDRLVDFSYESRFGAGKDRVEVKISRLAAKANKKLEVNSRPGIGGVDLVTDGQTVNATVDIKGRLGGQTVQRRYKVPVTGGARFHLGTALDQGDLQVGRIDRLFGQISGNTILRPQS